MTTNTGCLSPLQSIAGGRITPKKRDEAADHVNEEYLRAFRTKSYVEIYKKAELRNNGSPRARGSLLYLIEPRQEAIANMELHHLVTEYFEASLEACECCDTILHSIHQTRHSFENVTEKVVNDQNNHNAALYAELVSFSSMQSKPMSIISPSKFRKIRNRYNVLFQRLNSRRGKIRKMLTIKRVCKKVGAIGIIVSYSAIMVALLVFAAFHVSAVGLVAAPFVLASGFGFSRCSYCCSCSNERLYEQLDVAAKGVYILINDLDTMSRMVNRLHDEVEHRRVVADICLRNIGNCCETVIMKQVVREFCESNFLDQLEELEEHAYLCFLTINRSRRLVMQEIIMGEQC